MSFEGKLEVTGENLITYDGVRVSSAEFDAKLRGEKQTALLTEIRDLLKHMVDVQSRIGR